ncbi:hypothetical protein HMPREF1870_00455 [Bacteroidales bacterium KA00344]|nr:hypothetical protein HMPREF1870_00455 [Bacteroidales bacterium KA00344]
MTFQIKKQILIGFAIVATLFACGDTEDLYSRHFCRLFFDNSIYNDATLATAMTPNSGAFVTITIVGKQYVFTSNQGLSSKVNITAKEEQMVAVLGMNNGIIVGYGTSIPSKFYAYDRECPNCFDVNALPVRSYKLTVSDFGTATCAHCHRQYNMNNGGMVSKGDNGKKLTLYYATTTGPYGKLNI